MCCIISVYMIKILQLIKLSSTALLQLKNLFSDKNLIKHKINNNTNTTNLYIFAYTKKTILIRKYFLEKFVLYVVTWFFKNGSFYRLTDENDNKYLCIKYYLKFFK